MDNHAQQLDTARLALPRQRPATSPGSAAPALSVMLVEDTPDMLRLMRMTFDFHDGVEVRLEASNGLEALELWRLHRPAVVVMDLRMPVMSGLEAAAQMLAEDPGQRVVLFSASFRPADYALAETIGVSRCLDKCDLRMLPDVVEALAASA